MTAAQVSGGSCHRAGGACAGRVAKWACCSPAWAGARGCRDRDGGGAMAAEAAAAGCSEYV